ncbi:MAG: hypothetical protein RIN56_05525 [Sporomusaceae bacterium]|nr:hypothetical protein [Sporomusaceae bacterium]
MEHIYSVLPRLLALFDADKYSPTYGIGDRFYWGWKLIDFGNGSYQGAANGLARLAASGLLPDYLTDAFVEKKIQSLFEGAKMLTRANGSMEEAFPYESSFCVTALAAYDLLSCLEVQEALLSKSEFASRIEIIAPMVAFLQKAEENHGIISNHLATGAAALYKWNNFIEDSKAEKKGHLLLDRILKNMSPEGWMREYDGADPGYQTLALHYLADLHRIRPDLELGEVLSKSVRFLSYFAHPDGSFGGLYGSRNTRFFFPSGLEYLAGENPTAATLAGFMRNAIKHLRTVTLLTMDEPNLIPMFNSYCWAAALAKSVKDSSIQLGLLPCSDTRLKDVHFQQAGIFIKSTPEHYTVVAIKKGGVVASYSRDGTNRMIDGGSIVVRERTAYSTQIFGEHETEWDNGTLSVTVEPRAINHRYPKPWQFILLRVLNITMMRNRWFNGIIKKMLVAMLMTNIKKYGTTLIRKINFSGGLAHVRCEWKEYKPEHAQLYSGGEFKSIHMASAGYWQRGDEY